MHVPAERIRVVYIAGSSYSGSTLLGLILASGHGLFNPGEVKLFLRDRYRAGFENETCSCGNLASSCPFWSDILDELAKHEFVRDSSALEKLKIAARVPFTGRRKKRTTAGEEFAVYRTILDRANRFYDLDFRGLLDNSKGLWRLDNVASEELVDLQVVHLTRNPLAVARSYRKREGSFLKGLFIAVVHNLLLRIYLVNRGIPFIHVRYEALREDTSEVFSRLRGFLEIPLDEEGYAEEIRSFEHHVLGGNPMRLQYGSNLADFPGIQ